MDDVIATFNWGDGALHKFHETLKDALDPNAIMAPAFGASASAVASCNEYIIGRADRASRRIDHHIQRRLAAISRGECYGMQQTNGTQRGRDADPA
jgi:hypothetical protein